MNVVEMIDMEIEKLSLLRHSFYLMWSEGKLTVDHLQGYSREYYQLVKTVPKMVDAIASSAGGKAIAASIAANAIEEEQHISLWEKFAKSLGVSIGELSGHDKMTREAVESMERLSGLSIEQAAAAMYAYEAELPKISRSKIDGLKKFYNLSGGDATKYFEVHEEADVRHAQLWRDIMLAAPAEKHASMMESATASLEAQNRLLDSVQQKYVGTMYC